ncbi:MAG: hypothetical protein Q9216_006869, partial [Gyalolechia sp. 2 TL-2023]
RWCGVKKRQRKKNGCQTHEFPTTEKQQVEKVSFAPLPRSEFAKKRRNGLKRKSEKKCVEPDDWDGEGEGREVTGVIRNGDWEWEDCVVLVLVEEEERVTEVNG